MKYTMTAVLVAALAAVPSVVAAPLAAATTLLPDSFTLKVTTPTSGTALQKYLGQVTVDGYASQFLNIGTGSNQPQIPAVLFRDGDSSIHIENIDGLGDWQFSLMPNGWAIFAGAFRTPLTGLAQLNGALVMDTGDGKGPLALWSACPDQFFKQLWEVYWSPLASIKDCIPIGLTVVAV